MSVIEELNDSEESRLKNDFILMSAQAVSDMMGNLNRITMFRELEDVDKLSIFVQGTMTGIVGAMLTSFDEALFGDKKAAEALVVKHVAEMLGPVMSNIRLLQENGTFKKMELSR